MKNRTHSHLLGTTALVALLVLPTLAYAGPENGVVDYGSASITQGGNHTDIHQSTDRAIIRWDSFDLNASESVQFHQPSASSITVNRIRDNKPSQINGRISANGNIVLINPNGMVFGAASVVDVGGLVATSSDLKDDATFMQGGAVEFTKPGAHDSAVINHGSMTVRDGGLIGLVAPNVENHGIIHARLGKVALSSGNIATIDFAGDGLIKLEVTDDVLSQRVLNTGTITADGGDILLTAAQARGMVDSLVSNTGTLQARTVITGAIEQTGTVTLSTKGFDLSLPRGQGVVFNTGIIDVEGVAQNQSGGSITIVGDHITIGDGSYVTAAADKNGGTINIGGAYQGGPVLPTSDMVFISEHAILNANSRRHGKGGTIILWSDTNTRFFGHAESTGGVEGGDGGFIEISGKQYLTFAGTADLSSVHGEKGTLLLDPTDIVISSAADQNISGSSPYTPSVDNGPSVLNVTTLQNALALGNVIVQTRATGAQAGNITVDSAITWGSGSTLTLDAHNNIVVNQAITGQNLRFVVGNDLQLNANITGSGALTIQQAADSGTVGIGASAVGTLNLSAADLTRIVDGWSNITIGKSTGTAAMDVRAVTWTDNLTLLSGTGVITFNGTTNTGANTLTIQTDGDINLLGNLAGTGTLNITQTTASTVIGVGNSQTGTVNLTATEIGRINNGYADIILGRTDGTGAINMGALTWNDNLTVRSGTGVINVNGNQTMGANNLTVVTDADVNLAANFSGSSTLAIYGTSAATTMAFGNSQTGTINFTTTEVSRFANGWADIILGRTDGTGAINIGALTWNDNLTVQTGSGVISINGTQTMGANNITYRTDADMVIGGALTSTGNLTFVQTSAATSIGVGDSQAGTLSFSNADLAQITNGWNLISFGRTDGTAALNVAAQTWNDSLQLQTGSGVLNINGAQTISGGLTIRTDAALQFDYNLSGTGAFAVVQSSAGTSMGLGNAQAGDIQLDGTELARILDGWSSRTFGRIDTTGALNIAAGTWVDPLTLRTGSGALNINGNLTMGANNLTLMTDSNISVGGNLSGSGTVTVTGATNNVSIGLGDGQAGTIQFTNAELNRILNGWGNIVFGTVTQIGDINVGAYTWNDVLNLRTLGLVAFNGAQNFNANALNVSSNTIDIGANLTGTGAVTITATTATTTMGIGTGQAGTLQFSDDEINRFVNGFSSLTFGSTNQTGAVNIGASTWNDSLVIRNSTGAMNINGAISMGANNLTISTNSDLAINAAITGTATVSLHGSNNATTMGVGTGQTGTLLLTDTELSRISSGWSNVVFGSTGMTGTMNIGGRAWTHSTEFRTNTGALNINGAQDVGTKNLTIRTNTNLVIGQNLIGSGNISIMGSNNATTMGIGTGQTGTLQLSDTELNFIQNGWTTIIFGSTGITGAINVGAKTWNDSVDIRSNTGVISINGAQTMGANDLTIRSNANPVIGAALTGTGNLNFLTATTNVTMGVGTGQTGTYSLTDAELNFITDGWNLLTFGNAAQTVALNVGAKTWNDSVLFNTLTGVVTINGAQNLGANNLEIRSDGNTAIGAALTGTGTLRLGQTSANVTMGIGTGQSGNVSFTDTELGNITNGWANVFFGRTDSSSAMNIGNYTWNDFVTFQTGTGVITALAQTMGANNLTFSTNGNLALNGNLTGTGNLIIKTSSGTTGIGVGDTQAGTLALSNAELARFVNGWATITIGGETVAGNIAIGTNTWNDAMRFVTQGNVTLNGVQTSTEASGSTLVFATTNGAFINNAGASAINAGGGRYLVYSVDENNDTLGGINRPGIITNKTYAGYGPGSVTEAGSQHIYSGVVAKILYLTIDNASKVYGDTLPTFSYTYNGGLVNGDLLSDIILSYSLNAVGASVFDNAGSTRAITGSFNLGSGYTSVITNGTLTVTKAEITVNADPKLREYGDANPVFTASYSGFKNGEDETDINVLATATTTATVLSNVGSYAITVSGASDNNYNFVYVNDTLTIEKATLNATMQNASRIYGDANPTFTAVYTGFKNGESAAVIDTLATGASAGITANVGTYAITGSGALDNNYDFNYINGALTVTKATLTATANDASRIYGDANPGFTVSYSGFKNADTSAVIDTQATAASAANATSNVGTYAITASGALDNNYNFNYVNGTLTVNKATLTATAGNASREYGDANPAIGVSYTGFKNGETSAVIDTLATASSAANATSNVGTYATTASGATDNNYNFNYIDGTLTVTKATLTATAGNVSREYGDANPAIGVTYSGFKNGETSAVIDTLATGTTAATLTSNVGTYATTASGASDNNYNFNYTNGTLTINKATLTATAGNASREYGDANPTIGVSYSGFKNGETSAVIDTLATASSAANATSNVGSYSTTASGAADNNYNFNYVNGTLTVTKATLTATAVDISREYGDANPVIGVTYSGFKNGETSAVIDTLASGATAATLTSNVGTYATTASGAADNNYNFNYASGTLTINKATLTATAGNASREYGDANPAIGVTYSGFKNSETSAVIDTLATASSAANATSNVGTYATTASGGSDNNYNFNYVDGTLTINKATLMATAGNASRDYGDANPAIGVSYSGFKNGETSAVIDTLAIGASAATATSNVGNYTTTASGALDNNYNFTYADGTLTINKAMLIATAGNASREYGDINPTINVTYTGFKNGESSAVIDTLATGVSAATVTSNVGTYATTASGASDNNYDFTYANGLLSITKATLLATGNDAARGYGDSNPSFTATYTGFKNGETAAVIDTLATGGSTANALSGVGTYAITMSGALDNNYNFTYAGGTLTVNKAILTARPNDVAQNQGLPNPPLTISYSGFKNGETASVLNTLPTASTTVTPASAIGTYAITASGGFDDNYSFSFVNGVFTVLDPLYVPPPPVTDVSQIVPSTVTRSLGNSNIFLPADMGLSPTMGERSSAPQTLARLTTESDYAYVWNENHFLIAITDSVQNYYGWIERDDRRP